MFDSLDSFDLIRKILINDLSDLESFIKTYSLNCCCIYKTNKTGSAASRANTQQSSEYCKVHMRVILILSFLYTDVLKIIGALFI